MLSTELLPSLNKTQREPSVQWGCEEEKGVQDRCSSAPMEGLQHLPPSLTVALAAVDSPQSCPCPCVTACMSEIAW